MANVGFPQKSTFGVITATEVRTPLINTVGVNLVLQRDGSDKLTLQENALVAYKSLRLYTGANIVDNDISILLSGDGVGNIDDLAPITDADGVRTPLVNNPAGTLILQCANNAKLSLLAGQLIAYVHLDLFTDKAIRDAAANVLLAGDNAGHIDQLARIDANVTLDAGVTVDGIDPSTIPAHLVLEAANAQWINCPYEGAEFVAGDKMRFDGSMEAYHIAGAGRYVYSVPLPTTRGGKALHINGTRVSLSAADGTNRVYETNLYGMGDSTGTELDSDETNKNTVALHEDTSMGNVDLSSYDSAKVVLKTAVATEANLMIQYVTVRYFYA